MFFGVAACSCAVGFLCFWGFDEGCDCVFYVFGGLGEDFVPVHGLFVVLGVFLGFGLCIWRRRGTVLFGC